ncbi:ribose-phosphate pyrophosphokinase [Candidatus Parcubacteria bacterium]|nr:ribose-phosphate pyrophosphokinase [Candidatus Parcubacteria bacterium]
MFDDSKFVVFGCNGNHALDLSVINEVNDLSHKNLKFHYVNYGLYPDGEIDNQIPDYEEIKDKIAIIFQSAYTAELKEEFLDICRLAYEQYGAKMIVAILPFMYSRRQDHEDDIKEANRNEHFIMEMAARGVKHLILCDIHSLSTIDKAKKHGISAYNVDPARIYASRLRLLVELAKDDGRDFYIYALDRGSIPRAIALAKLLNVPIAVNLKDRKYDGTTERISNTELLEQLSKKYGVDLIEVDKSLNGSIFCIREDELSTGGSVQDAGGFLRNDIKAHELFFCVTHMVCAPGWKRKLVYKNPFDNIFAGNTIPRNFRNSTGGKITTVSMYQGMAHQLIKIIRKL